MPIFLHLGRFFFQFISTIFIDNRTWKICYFQPCIINLINNLTSPFCTAARDINPMLYQFWFTIYDTHWPSIGSTMGQSIVFDWNAGGGFPAQTSLQIEFRRSLRFDHTMNIRLCINNLGDLFIIIQQEQRDGPALFKCWPNGVVVGSALRQSWDTVSITKPGRYLCDVWLIKVTH